MSRSGLETTKKFGLCEGKYCRWHNGLRVLSSELDKSFFPADIISNDFSQNQMALHALILN